MNGNGDKWWGPNWQLIAVAAVGVLSTIVTGILIAIISVTYSNSNTLIRLTEQNERTIEDRREVKAALEFQNAQTSSTRNETNKSLDEIRSRLSALERRR